jgi:hypothetical protein
MSSHSAPESGNGDSEQAQSGLLKTILDNQEAIQGLSDRLMPLLVGNLQRLAESNVHPPQYTEADGQAPRDPRRCRWEPAAQHVAPSGESDVRMRINPNRGNAAHVYENYNHLTGNAAGTIKATQPRAIKAAQAQSHPSMGAVVFPSCSRSSLSWKSVNGYSQS